MKSGGQVPRQEASRQQVQQLTRPHKELAWGTPRQGPECAVPKRNSHSKGHIGIKQSAGSRGLAKWKGLWPAVPDLKGQFMWGPGKHPLLDTGLMEALEFWHYLQCQELQERILKFPSCPVEQRLKIKNISENKVILCCTSEFIVRLLLAIWLFPIFKSWTHVTCHPLILMWTRLWSPALPQW